MEKKQKEKIQEKKEKEIKIKNFKKWEFVKIIGWLHEWKVWEVYDIFIRNGNVFFQVVIDEYSLEYIDQKFLSPK